MPTRWRIALLLLVLALTLGFAWSARHPKITVQKADPALVHARAAALRGPERPRPDRRWLIAIADLHHLLTGEPRRETEVSLEAGRWKVAYAGTPVAELGPFPDYPELRGILVAWAGRLGAERMLAGADEPGVEARATDARIDEHLQGLRPLPALALVDQEWAGGRRDAALLARASWAYRQLALVSVDRVGAADSLLARALAINTLAALADAEGTIRDECLLVERLGYGASACELAGHLPAGDAVRAYVQGDRPRPERDDLARASREDRFIRLADVARRGELEIWSEIAERELVASPNLALPLLSYGLTLGRFESRAAIGASMIEAVSEDLHLGLALPQDAADGDDLAALGRQIDEFEMLMQGMPASADGAVLDRAVLRGYYRACFYSGLKAISDQLLHALSSIPSAEAFAAELGDDGPGAGGEFRRWFTHMTLAKAGHPVGEELSLDLERTTHFGYPLLAETFAYLAEYTRRDVQWAPPGTVRRLVGRLDTRPEHLRLFGALLTEVLMDPVGADTVYRVLVTRAHPADVTWWVWWARYEGEVQPLEAIALSPERTLEERVQALEAWDESGAGDSVRSSAMHAQLLAEYPADFRVNDRVARHLESRGRFVEARKLLQVWFGRRDRSTREFDEIFARTHLARLYQREGLPQLALQTVEPVVGSYQAGAMKRAALILNDLGRKDEAEKLSYAVYRRYPDSEFTCALVIQMLWERGAYREAGKVMAEGGAIRDPEVLREHLVPALRAVTQRGRDEVPRLVDGALRATQANWVTLHVLSQVLDGDGDHQLAFELAEGIRIPRDDGRSILLKAYGYRKSWQGQERALGWLREELAARDENVMEPVLVLAFGRGHDELLWELPWPPLDDPSAEYLWLLRAGAVARPGSVVDEARRAEVVEHFSRPGTGHYRTLGRFLLGLDPAEAVLASDSNPRRMGEAYYFLGLKARFAGDYRAAAGWYARCIGLNQRMNAEDHWAREQLALWISKEMSLERIAELDRRAAGGGARPPA